MTTDLKDGYYWYFPAEITDADYGNPESLDWQASEQPQIVQMTQHGIFMIGVETSFAVTAARGRFVGPLVEPQP